MKDSECTDTSKLRKERWSVSPGISKYFAFIYNALCFLSLKEVMHTIKSSENWDFITTYVGKLQKIFILSPSSGINTWHSDLKYTYFVFSN